MDYRPFVTFDTFFPFLLYPAENVALRHYDKAQIWVLKSLPQCTFADHHFPRKQFMRQISAVKRRDLVILQILAKPLCTRSRGRKHQHAVPVFLQPQDILRKQRKIVIIRWGCLNLEIVFVSDIKFLNFHIQRRHKEQRQFRQFFQKHRQRKQNFHLSRQNISLFETAYHTLAEFILHRFAFFDTACRLVKINADIFSLKIIKK